LIKRPAVAILIVIAGLAAADFLIFRKLFLIHNVYDPVTYELLAAWNGIAR